MSLLYYSSMLLHLSSFSSFSFSFFFFNDPATTEIYTLSLHDALPIFAHGKIRPRQTFTASHVNNVWVGKRHGYRPKHYLRDRKSTRLNSSHRCISYAVFCLKKKKKKNKIKRIKKKKK